MNFYRSISIKEAIEAAKSGHLMYYSSDPMSNDWEVIEYSLGDSVKDMTENDIDEWINEIIPWKEKNKGVNISTDFQTANGYSDVTVKLNLTGSYGEFSREYIFAEKPEECLIEKLFYKDKEYSPEKFLKKI